MRKLLSLIAGIAMLCFSSTGSAANPAEPAAPAQDGTIPALTAIAGQGMMSAEAYDDSPKYKFTHHSAVDTFDKVKPDLLTRDATVMGLTAFWIADRPERLASPWPAERTARMLVEKHNDTMLKSYGIWPFGDLGKPEEKKPAVPASPSGGTN